MVMRGYRVIYKTTHLIPHTSGEIRWVFFIGKMLETCKHVKMRKEEK